MGEKGNALPGDDPGAAATPMEERAMRLVVTEGDIETQREYSKLQQAPTR